MCVFTHLSAAAMLGDESCWCCPTCSDIKQKSRRRRERKVSFKQRPSPSKRLAYSLPEQDGFNSVQSADIPTFVDTLDPCLECLRSGNNTPYYSTVVNEDGTEDVMCLRCEKRKRTDLPPISSHELLVMLDNLLHAHPLNGSQSVSS